MKAASKSLLNHYKIAEKLGIGTFAVVKRCVRIEDKKELSIKIIKKSDMNGHDLQSLKTEVAVMKQLEHPNMG